MIVVIQRVSEASVEINHKITTAIKQGLLLLVGIEESDTSSDISWLSKKIINLRIFDDNKGVMNKSVLEVEGSILVVSQFTLHASTIKGNRPSYSKAAHPKISLPLYNDFVLYLENIFGKKVSTGKFGADMNVKLVNDGPVTIIIDSKDRK